MFCYPLLIISIYYYPAENDLHWLKYRDLNLALLFLGKHRNPYSLQIRQQHTREVIPS